MASKRQSVLYIKKARKCHYISFPIYKKRKPQSTEIIMYIVSYFSMTIDRSLASERSNQMCADALLSAFIKMLRKPPCVCPT